jgi:hypothetical protein
MKFSIPQEVVKEALIVMGDDFNMEAAIQAALAKWVECGGAKEGRGYLFALDRDDWQADTSLEPSRGDEFPVLIIRLEGETK